MGTYSRPGTGVSPYMIDRSAELLSKELDKAGTDLVTQKENIRISQNQGAEEIAKLKKGINSIAGGDELTFKDKSIDMLNEEVDNLDLLMRNSIGRDQTEYIKARTNLMGLPELYTKTLTLLDSKSEEYNGIADQARQILNSTSTEARAFMNDIANNDGNNITPSYKNGNLILTYNGKDDQGRDQEYVLNANNWIKANNSGTGNIINYSKIGEHEKEWGTLVDNTIKNSNLKPEVIKSIKELGGGKINTKTVENYIVAKESLTKRLLENTNLLPTLDESTWQFFNPGEEWNPKDKDDIDKLKEEVVEYLVDQKLGLDKVTTSQVESFKRRQGGSGSSSKQKVYVDYKDWVKKSLGGNEVPYAPGRAPGDYKLVAEKLMDINPNRFLLGKDLKADEKGLKIKKYENFDDNKLYIKSGETWEPYTPLNTDLSLDKINRILIDATQPDVENKKASIL